MNFQFNPKSIKYFYEDVLIIYARFGYEIFIARNARDLKLSHSLKKLLNEAVIGKVNKTGGVINYKLSKFVVERCQNYDERHPEYRQV